MKKLLLAIPFIFIVVGAVLIFEGKTLGVWAEVVALISYHAVKKIR